MQDLNAYVDSCLSQGFSKQEIQAGLEQAGWESGVINKAFNLHSETSLPTVQASSARHLPGWFIPTVVSASAALFLSTGVIAFAEHGYIPVLSKVYRATPLPLLWGGTNANSDVVVSKILMALSQNPGAETVGSLQLTVQESNGAAKVSFEKVPLLAAILTPKPVTALADIAPGGTAGLADPLSPDSLLPATIRFTSTSAHDQGNDLKLDLGLDLGDLSAKLAPLVGQFTKMTIPQKISVNGLVIHNTKKAYVRSNLIPYLTLADTNKWLNFDIPDSYLKQFDQQALPQSYNKETLAPYRTLLKRILKDDGIVRKNNEALAKYEITLDPVSLAALAAEPTLKEQASALKAAASAKTTLHVTLWAEPQKARLRFYELSASATLDSLGVDTKISMSEEIRYQLSEAIIAPPTAQTIVQPGAEYFDQISNSLIEGTDKAPTNDTPTFSSTNQVQTAHLSAANAQRKGDMTELEGALFAYKDSDTGNGTFPSTGGKMELLDSSTSTLARLGKNGFSMKMPLFDPLPNKYHYGYLSNGKTFRAICVITSTTDANKVDQTYVVTDKGSTLVKGLQQ